MKEDFQPEPFSATIEFLNTRHSYIGETASLFGLYAAKFKAIEKLLTENRPVLTEPTVGISCWFIDPETTHDIENGSYDVIEGTVASVCGKNYVVRANDKEYDNVPIFGTEEMARNAADVHNAKLFGDWAWYEVNMYFPIFSDKIENATLD
jgi:hypothetical protein